MEARDLRARARQSLEGQWWLSIGVAFVAGLLGALLISGGGQININLDERTMRRLPDIVVLILQAYVSIAGTLGLAQFILGGVVQLGYCSFLLKQHDGEKAEFQDLFSKFDHFGQGFAQAFLRGLYVFLWSLLLIIPGIVKSFSYAMTPFIMVENPDMSANEAITASRKLMDGRKTDLFWLGLTFIGWTLLSLLTLNLGSIALNPYMNAAYAAFYRSLVPRSPAGES